MQVPSTTFLCDKAQCRNSVTVMDDPDKTSTYLELVERGWKVSRAVWSAWKHYCPEHASESGS